ncbi:hypothetical protein VOLCADRAFT_96961 [Volvox carteri f. nagariensis]|uniref:Uncharacterized protein n=1 Tax=Volvox carteri f. nagariensis TaxID=3068 RepID=D8UBF5_VOLCA|nr:uncharacterized protein VOLCADRAFT_96961 [Volvox carteri f. nagariensis]EFJ42939.1 hypothetical protein VOLCADRAFT_96961 [Volvox carteri f. nagariensis]|eukprot:XP_002955979.1 hypothetical protein VOLCADRAFT_96961 [Volvox carteri f. nagariensis]
MITVETASLYRSTTLGWNALSKLGKPWNRNFVALVLEVHSEPYWNSLFVELLVFQEYVSILAVAAQVAHEEQAQVAEGRPASRTHRTRDCLTMICRHFPACFSSTCCPRGSSAHALRYRKACAFVRRVLAHGGQALWVRVPWWSKNGKCGSRGLVMASSYPPQAPEARGPAGRVRSGQLIDAELLAPPEVDPVQLSRSMFSQPASRPPPAPLTNLHLKKVARLDTAAAAATAAADEHADGAGGRGATAAARIRSARSARSARSVTASSVRGGRAAFSIVSDEEVIDVEADGYDNDAVTPGGGDAVGGPGHRTHGNNRAGPLGMSGIAGLAADEHGGTGLLEELEADTPAVRLEEVKADLEAAMQQPKPDPWAVVRLAQMALGHAKVVCRTMPGVVKEEPLLLAKAHYSLARAYQGLGGCDRQASDHGKQALAAIPREVMRAEALLSSATVSGIPPEAACNQARKALALLVKAAGLQEPVAWTSEEVEDNDLGVGVQRSTIDAVKDAGIVALMAQSHGVLAECKLKEADAEEAERKSSLRSAEEAASRLDRRTERGDAFYSPEQLDKYRSQVQAYRNEADNHLAEVVRLAGEAERSYDAAMYCLNHVIDIEGSRLEDSVGREGKLSHPTFQALWKRSLDFFAGISAAYAAFPGLPRFVVLLAFPALPRSTASAHPEFHALLPHLTPPSSYTSFILSPTAHYSFPARIALQRKDAERLGVVNEILSVFAQYGHGGWLPPARHIQALKDKGALLVDKRDYEGATACYEELTSVVSELFVSDPMRKELQLAEVLKLRGDVALASGDFRTAQHMFNQALEYYQRHLGLQAPVAQDLLHRIDEVKGYLADTRVMGRLASLPSSSRQQQTSSPTPPAGNVAAAAGASGGGATGGSSNGTSSSPGPGSVAGGGNGGGLRSSAPSVASPSVRSSVDGESQSHSYSQRTGVPVSLNLGGGGATASQRPPSALGPPLSARSAATSSVRGSVEGQGGGGDAGGGGSGGWAMLSPAAASAAGAQRRSGSDLTGHNWAAAAVAATPAAVASPAPSSRSYRSGGDVGPGGGVTGGFFAPVSGGPPSVSGASQRSGAAASGGLEDRMYGSVASPAAQSHRSAFSNGAASPAAQSQRSGVGGGGGYGGMAASTSQSLHSADFANLRGYGNTVPSHPRASGAIGGDDDEATGGADEYGVYGNASPAVVSANRRLGGNSGDVGSRSHRSVTSAASGGGAANGGYGGLASPSARSQRSGVGFDAAEYGGAASPAVQSQRSGYSGYGGGGVAYSSNYGGAGSAAPPSQRSGEFSQPGRINSSSSFRRSNNDPMEF